MNLQEKVNPQEEAQKIWEQLDAEEDGNSPQDDDSLNGENPATEQTADRANAPAESADAGTGAGQEPASEQGMLDKITGLETMLSQVTQRLRNAEGHIGGLNGQLKQQLQAAKQVATTGGEAPTAKEIRAAQANPEAMDSLKRDYPEFAGAMESALNERLSVLEQRLQTAQPQMQQPSVTNEQIDRMRSEFQVEVRHPGWLDRVSTPDFQGWLHRQPREVQMLAASESPQDAIRLLDLHGDAVKSVSTQRTQRLSSAASIPTGRSGSNTRGKAVEDMTPQEYWRYLDEIEKQKR